MPFDTSLRCLGYHYVPHQMAEVDRSFRVGERVEYESCSSISCKVRVEILLHDSDERHRSLAARRFRILDHLAEYNGPSDIQNFFLSVVIIPSQSLEFFRPKSGERQYHEGGLSGVVIDGGHQVINFFEGVCMGIGFVASDAVRSGNRIEVNQAGADGRPEGPAQEVLECCCKHSGHERFRHRPRSEYRRFY